MKERGDLARAPASRHCDAGVVRAHNAERPILCSEEGAPRVPGGCITDYSSVPVDAFTASVLVPNSAIQWGAGLAVTASDSSMCEHLAL